MFLSNIAGNGLESATAQILRTKEGFPEFQGAFLRSHMANAVLTKRKIRKFAKFLVTRIKNRQIDFIRKENNAARFVTASQVASEGIDFDRRIDHRSGNDINEIDALDELDVLARDDTDRAILQLRSEGFKDREIGAQLGGMTQQAVSKRARAMEARLDQRLAVVAEDETDERLLKLRAEGNTDKQVARALDITPATFGARLSGLQRRFERRPKLFPARQDSLKGGLALAV